MRVFIVLFFSFFLQFAYPFAAVVNDPVTQGILIENEFTRAKEILAKVLQVKSESEEIMELVKTYKKLIEDIACNNSNLFALIARVKKYGFGSCLFDGEIRLLSFNIQAQSKIFDMAGEIAKAIISGGNSGAAKDSFLETNKKFLAAAKEYQQQQSSQKKIEDRLSAIEAVYLSYEKDAEEFEKYYDNANKI